LKVATIERLNLNQRLSGEKAVFGCVSLALCKVDGDVSFFIFGGSNANFAWRFLDAFVPNTLVDFFSY
jgi:hypothetical protein